MKNNSELSYDTIFEGRLRCWQHSKGYRFSIDSVLLAHFCLHWKKAEILDMGCGCGILGLILLYRIADNITSIEGLEYQHSLAKLARLNIKENGFEHCFNIIEGDYSNISCLYKSERFSHIICNPPFYKPGSGRTSSNEEAKYARHQKQSTLLDIAAGISYVLKNKGTAALIYPADRLAELISQLIGKKLQPKRLRFIYSYPEAKEANIVLIECVKNGGEGMKVLSPLYIYSSKKGSYTEEVENMYLP